MGEGGEVPPVSAAVLAAGQGRRMGAMGSKLLLPVQGEPMVRRVVHTAIAAGFEEVLVVVGHQAEAVRDALDALPVRFVLNPRHADGLASSVRVATAALPAHTAMLCLLGDMPTVQPGTLRRLVSAWQTKPTLQACRPTFGDRPGNPVLWSPRARPLLATLQGDEGGRQVIATLGPGLVLVPVDDPGVLLDLDRPEDLQQLVSAPPPPADADRP